MEMSCMSLPPPPSSSPVNEKKWVLIQSRVKPRKAPQSNLKWDIFWPNVKDNELDYSLGWALGITVDKHKHYYWFWVLCCE